MQIADMAALRAIEERVTGRKRILPRPGPIHPPEDANISEFVSPPRPIRKPKVIKKRKAGLTKDKLKAYIEAQNSRADF